MPREGVKRLIPVAEEKLFGWTWGTEPLTSAPALGNACSGEGVIASV